MPDFISEDQIEKAAVALLKEQCGYRTVNCSNISPTLLRERRLNPMNDSASSIISKVWSFCNTLRDDGVGYGD